MMTQKNKNMFGTTLVFVITHSDQWIRFNDHEHLFQWRSQY